MGVEATARVKGGFRGTPGTPPRAATESVLESISDHKIDGDAFLQLDDQGLKEIAPLLGDRFKIKRVMKSILDEITPVTVSWLSTCISYE